jgi:multimeric flavodoxin WrbA
MKIRLVGISSSPKNRNTSKLIEVALESARSAILKKKDGLEIETKMVSLAGKKIQECFDCKECVRKGSLCVLKDRWYECVKPLIDPVPDGVIMGSPVYFFSVNAKMRAFIERCTCLFKKAWNPDFPFSLPDWTKTAAGVITSGFHRSGGQEHAAADIIHSLLAMGFVTVGSFSLEDGPIGYIAGTAWSGCVSKPGDIPIVHDEIGLHSVKLLGARVGETALILKSGDDCLNSIASS